MPTTKKKLPVHRGAPPARAGTASTTQICIRVTIAERERWQAGADRTDQTMSDIARAAWERVARRSGGRRA